MKTQTKEIEKGITLDLAFTRPEMRTDETELFTVPIPSHVRKRFDAVYWRPCLASQVKGNYDLVIFALNHPDFIDRAESMAKEVWAKCSNLIRFAGCELEEIELNLPAGSGVELDKVAKLAGATAPELLQGALMARYFDAIRDGFLPVLSEETSTIGGAA